MAINRHLQHAQAAADGYSGAAYNPAAHGMLTSSLHAAYCVGEFFRATGRTAPAEVRPGRGDLMHCNGMLFRLNWCHVRHPTISRER